MMCGTHLRLASAAALVTLAAISSAVSQESQPKAFAVDRTQLQWGACPAFMPKGCELTVLNGDPAKPNADVFLRLPGGSTVPRHWHTSAERMVLVSGELHVTYDGQKTAVLKAGNYAYGPAKVPHVAVCRSTAPCVLFIAFESAVDAHEGAPVPR